MRLFTLLLCFIGLVLAAACSKKLDSSSSDDADLFGTPPGGSPQFVAARAILVERCAHCHSSFAGLSAQEWAVSGYVVPGAPAVSPLFQRLRGAQVTGPRNMPADSSLTSAEIQTLSDWIASIGPDVLPPDTTSSALFLTTIQPLLKQRCLECHSFPLSSERALVSSGYAVPGRPAQSPLFTRLQGSGAGAQATMPLDRDPIPASERAAIQAWLTGLRSSGTTEPTAPERTQAALAVLTARCASCHATGRTATSVDYSGAAVPAFSAFTSDAAFVQAGLVIPGSKQNSWLFRALKVFGDMDRMPQSGAPLTAAQSQSLEKWILLMNSDGN